MTAPPPRKAHLPSSTKKNCTMKLHFTSADCSLAAHIVAHECGLPLDLDKADLAACPLGVR